MKITRFLKKFRLLFIVFLALITISIITGHYLTRKYSKEWNYWKRLPKSVKYKAIELQFELFWHRIFTPPVNPERYVHVTADSLENSMCLGADWLLDMQESSGRFQYWYNPIVDQFSSKSNDNFLRQAGTSFSLMLVYEMTGDSRYLAAARRSVNYLLNFKEKLGNNKAYFFFNQKAKLGGISLPMLTMLKIRQLTGTEEYDELLKKLANMILYLQEKYQTGEYKSTYVYRGDFEYEKHSGWKSKIYPGEALFALAEMYRAFGDERYKNSMDWALKFYYNKERWKSHAFLPWTISAFTSLYEQTKKEKYAEYVFFLTEHLLTQQNLDSDDKVYGSFHALPSANTGSYLEGLGDAIHLAQLTADEKRLKLYKKRAKIGYRWLFLLQYTESDVAGLNRPEMVLGGFRPNLFESQLRIDNTQHAISSFARGLRFIFGVKPKSTSCN